MIGASVITKGGISQGFCFAKACGCTAAQLYVAPSRTWLVPVLADQERQSFRANWAASSVASVNAHASLLLNLASDNAELREKSAVRLRAEMERCVELGIEQIVLHPGSNPNHVAGIANLVGELNRLAKLNLPVKVLLENMAGQGNTLGASFEQLREILWRLEKRTAFGICVDTCHAFAAGYDIRGYDGYMAFIDSLAALFPLSEIGVFHVNDSKVDLGKRVDRHGDMIGEGYIGIEAFRGLMEDVRFSNVPMIAEVPNTELLTRPNVARLIELRAGTFNVPLRQVASQGRLW